MLVGSGVQFDRAIEDSGTKLLKRVRSDATHFLRRTDWHAMEPRVDASLPRAWAHGSADGHVSSLMSV